MNLDPRMGTVDRIGNVVIGVAVTAYAVLGGLDAMAVRAVLVVLGIVLVIGGVGGT